jgi:hypothetical protein
MPVAPYTRAEIDGLRRTLADGTSADREAIRANYEALPRDMQRALAPLLWPQLLAAREPVSAIPADDPALQAVGVEIAQADETLPSNADAPPEAEPPRHWNGFRVMTEEEWRAREAAQSSRAGAPPIEPAPGSPEYQAADAEAQQIVAGQQSPAVGGSSSGAPPPEPPPGSPEYRAADAEARRLVAEAESARGEAAKKPATSPAQLTSYAPTVPEGFAIGKAAEAVGTIARVAPRVIAGAGTVGATVLLWPGTAGVTSTRDINDRLRVRTVAPERDPHIEYRVDDGWFGSGIGATWEEIPGAAKGVTLPDGRQGISLDLDRLKEVIDDKSMSDLLGAPGIVMARPPSEDDEDDDERRRGRKRRREWRDTPPTPPGGQPPPPPMGHNGPPGPLEPEPARRPSQDSPSALAGSGSSGGDQDEAERRRSWDAAVQISMGHAYKEHVEVRREFPRITNRRQYAEFIHRIMMKVRNTKDYKNLPDSGRRGYWDEETRTLVIEDSLHPDGGSAYKPTEGRKAFEDLRDR